MSAQTLMRVCVLMVVRLAIVSPALCRAELLTPLAAPLLAVLAPSAVVDDDEEVGEVDIPIRTESVYEKYVYPSSGIRGGSGSGSGGVTRVRNPAVLVDAPSLQSSVELLHLLLTLCPLHKALAGLLYALRVDVAMLRLYARLLPPARRQSVDAQLFDTVESFCVNFTRFGGAKLAPRLQVFLVDSTTQVSQSGWDFSLTTQGLVEIRLVEGLPGAVLHSDTHVGGVSLLSDVLHAAKIRSSSNNKKNNTSETAIEGVQEVEMSLPLQTQQRLAAIVSLVLIFETSWAAKQNRMDVTTSTPTTTSPPAPASGSEKEPSESSTPAGGYELLASELFLLNLAGFLHLPPLAGTNMEALGADAGDAALCGMVLLELQEKLPLQALLRDGELVCAFLFPLPVFFVIYWSYTCILMVYYSSICRHANIAIVEIIRGAFRQDPVLSSRGCHHRSFCFFSLLIIIVVV